MKHQPRCKSDVLFFHMARRLSGTGGPWTAMDAYLQIVETCNRCTIRDCPGMLALDLPDQDAEHDVPPFGSAGAVELVLPAGIDEIQAEADAATVSSLFALSDAIPRSGVDCEPRQEGVVETEAEPSDGSALARLLGWNANEALG